MSDSPDNSQPSWKRWALWTLVWTLPGLLQCLQEITYARVAAGQDPQIGRILLHFLPTWYPWILFTPLVVGLARRFPVRRGRLTRSLPLHLLGSAVFACLHIGLVGLARVNFPPGGGEGPAYWEWVRFTLWGFSTHMAILAYCLIVAATQAIDSSRELRQRDLRAARLEGQLARARVAALRSQLQPHFLFNTLNSIAVLMREEVETAEAMLHRLSDLLRVALDHNGAAEVTLEQELDHLRRYVSIESVRFSDRLAVDYQVSEEVLGARVPNLLLQPLVENAIAHGVAQREEGGRVVIRAHHRDGQLLMSIEDDGPGISDGYQEGIGLFNTRERLRERYGDAHAFDVQACSPVGTRVELRLPYEELARA